MFRLPDKTLLFKMSKALIAALLILLLLRAFVFDITPIHTPAMAGTLLSGDFIGVNKLPFSTPGSPHVERNEVLVFHLPDFNRQHVVMRCVALPGDSIYLNNSQVLVNGKTTDESETLQFNYSMHTDSALPSDFYKERLLDEGGAVSEKGDYSFSLTPALAEELKKLPGIKSLEKRTEKAGLRDELCFPFNTHYLWNADQYGPLYVPQKGDTLKLDTLNIALYKAIITVYEKNKLILNKDIFVINGDTTNYYVTRQNYYFVMGDNRHNALDSRHHGFIPEDRLIGKAEGIFFSYNKKNSSIRWKRCLSRIR